MRIGQANIDFETNQITGPAGNYAIEPKVMEVLWVLIDNAEHVVTRDSLIDQVWGVGYGGDERLSRAISLLRKSLGDTRGRHKYIQTIPRKGYKLSLRDAQPIRKNTAAPSEKNADMADQSLRGGKTKKWIRWIPVLSAALLALAALLNFAKNNKYTFSSEPPLVMIMDSAHPARIYDEEVKSAGATNADILSDILSDLPIKIQKELISPSWHRYEAMIQFKPDLIVIHYSGFKQEDASGDRPQLRFLVECFLKTDTEFLIYSRANHDWLDGNVNVVLKDLYMQNPKLKERIFIFPLLDYGEPNWKDINSSLGIKLKIKNILDIE